MSAGRSRTAEWTFIAVLVISCALLAVLQFRWTGEITTAERDRAHTQLANRLEAIRGQFNSMVDEALGIDFGDPHGPPRRYSAAHGCLFSRAVFAARGENGVEWLAPNMYGQLEPTSPPVFASVVERHLNEPPGGPVYRNGYVLRDVRGFDLQAATPRMGPRGEGFREPRLIEAAQLDEKCLTSEVMPRLVGIYFGPGDQSEYDVRILDEANSRGIYESSAGAATLTARNADASTPLLGMVRGGPPRPGMEPGGAPPGFGPEPRDPFLPPPVSDRAPGGVGDSGLLLAARHKAGSLDAMVAGERKRNLAISGAMLLLIAAAGLALVRFSQDSARLAELRMNIVAGVSHELRSPLTVIRTAAFNLQREGFAARPDQVRRLRRADRSREQQTGAVD